MTRLITCLDRKLKFIHNRVNAIECELILGATIYLYKTTWAKSEVRWMHTIEKTQYFTLEDILRNKLHDHKTDAHRRDLQPT